MVPEGWKREPLCKIAEVRTGIAKGKKNLKKPISVPYLRVANVQDGHLDLSVIKTIEVEDHQINRYRLHVGDVLMTEGGDFDKLGRGDVWKGEIDPCLHQNHVFCVRPDQQIILPYFLSSLSGSSYGKFYFLSCAKKSTNLASINSTQLKEFPVLIPPLPEQKKIARILSTWDKAIETVEKLIENSQAQKKALMQQLLTGKRRLPGFDDGWLTYKLSEIFHFKKGKGLSKGEINSDGKYKCILYGELYTKYAEIIHTVASRTNSNNALNSTVGDVLIPCSTTTSGIDLANATCLQESNVLLGGDITVLRPKNQNIDPEFIAYLLTHIKKHEIARLAQGITIIHLYGRDLKNISITLPSIDEQKEIARIIKNSDKEIGIMNEQLNQLQAEKKALMQQLLTGKRRVQIN